MSSNMTEKQCNKCNRVLPIEQFAKRHDTVNGYCGQCRECIALRKALWRAEHPTYNKEYCEAHRKSTEKLCRVTNDLRSMTLEQRRQYVMQQTKRRKTTNEYRKYRRTYFEKHTYIDIDLKLKHIIRNRISQSISNNRNYKHSVDLLGCSIEDVRKHIERQFKPGMAWENWSLFGWHIDHIIPIASFDFTDYEQQKKCFHYTNLQPLWAIDNHKKRDKIETKQLMLI